MSFFWPLRMHFFNLKSLLVILCCLSLIGCANLTSIDHSKKETKVVIAGSYHKSIEEICQIKKEMEKNGIKVLEPLCGKVINPGAEFIVLENDKPKTLNDETYRNIQKRFINNCKKADYIYIYNGNQNGYIGLSTAFEIGFVKGIGKKIYINTPPKDKGLQAYDFGQVISVNDFIKKFRKQP